VSCDPICQVTLRNSAMGFLQRAIIYTHPLNQCSDTVTGARVDQRRPMDGNIDDCAICMCPPTLPKRLPCGHSFCTQCIQQAFARCQPKCPTCGHVCGKLSGNQPPGQMSKQILRSSLRGYEPCSTIEITYSIPDGIQDVRE